MIPHLAKNLKLLFRSKESAYTILAGPLLIILIVSFAFLGSSDEYDIRVGTAGRTELADATIARLNGEGYSVAVYPEEEPCVNSVISGRNNACLSFEGEDVTFFVDRSRVNFVSRIVEDLSDVLDVQADAIRKELATSTLTRLEVAAGLIDDDHAEVERISADLAQVGERLREASDAISTINVTAPNTTDLVQLRSYHQGIAQDAKNIADMAEETIDDAIVLLADYERDCPNCSPGIEERVSLLRAQAKETEDSMREIAYDSVDDKLSEMDLLVEYAMDTVEEAESAIAQTASSTDIISARVTPAALTVSDDARELSKMSDRLAYTAGFLRGETSDADDIATPFSTRVVSVTVNDDSLSFAYPYLLILVIMFIGMLLASTLVVADKTSRAAFRNFTTPVSDGFRIGVAFLTAFLILFVEVIVILIVSTLFVAQPLLLNPLPTFLIICVAIVLFTFLGMIVGYMSKTQEAAMIACISVASVLLFVSNLIIPIEGMARLTQAVTTFNPYIVLSELLKRSMLYGVGFLQALRDIALLFLFVLVLFGITAWVQRRAKERFFKQEEQPRAAIVPLALGEQIVRDEVSLLDALDRMTRQEFDALMKADPGTIPSWAERELRDRKLARQLRTASKERMMLALDKHLRRQGKKHR